MATLGPGPGSRACRSVRSIGLSPARSIGAEQLPTPVYGLPRTSTPAVSRARAIGPSATARRPPHAGVLGNDSRDPSTRQIECGQVGLRQRPLDRLICLEHRHQRNVRRKLRHPRPSRQSSGPRASRPRRRDPPEVPPPRRGLTAVWPWTADQWQFSIGGSRRPRHPLPRTGICPGAHLASVNVPRHAAAGPGAYAIAGGDADLSSARTPPRWWRPLAIVLSHYCTWDLRWAMPAGSPPTCRLGHTGSPRRTIADQPDGRSGHLAEARWSGVGFSGEPPMPGSPTLAAARPRSCGTGALCGTGGCRCRRSYLRSSDPAD